MQENKILRYPPKEFADSISGMYAPFEKYVANVVPLMLEHAWTMKMEKGTTTLEALMNCAWIGRLITLDTRVIDVVKQTEIPGWIPLQHQLIKRLDQCSGEEQLPGMTHDCMHLLYPVLKERFQDNYHFPSKEFHCWWYTIHDDNTHLALHLVNAYQPGSPFDQLHHFLTTMLKAVEQAVKTYPAIRVVSCGSWLNGLAKFQYIWPDSFREHVRILNATGGFGPGAWGQYMTMDGGFNEAKAAQLRQTGIHPYPLTEARSTVEEVRAHLHKIIALTP
ncbi:hypothetical protein [Chitinophaga sp. MM2321]|uniref:hypothetical protein n=1 Tax=Chitinophaga sp. MM2321 TaxID=3137178 RepID=UPI0032D581CD